MKDNFGITPLLCALWENHLNVAKYLIDKVSYRWYIIIVFDQYLLKCTMFFREQLQRC